MTDTPNHVEVAARLIVNRSIDHFINGKHYADCELYHLPCFALLVLSEIGPDRD